MKNFKVIISFVLCFLLLVICIKYFVTDEQKALFFEIKPKTHLISYLFCLSTFILSGFEMKYAYNKFANLKVSNYDIVALPLSMNFWGIVIPIQGATLYMLAYLKFKYKVNIGTTLNIYLFVFLISLSIGGLAGILFLAYSQIHSVFSYFLFTLIFLNPIIVFASNKLIRILKAQNKIIISVQRLLNGALSGISILLKNPLPIAILIAFSILTTLLNTIWAYWVSLQFNMQVPFTALLVMFFLLRVTMLLKVTPGNIGIIQLASGGLIALLGFASSDAIFITSIQSISTLLVSFTLGLLFSVINRRHFTFSQMKQVFKSAQ